VVDFARACIYLCLKIVLCYSLRSSLVSEKKKKNIYIYIYIFGLVWTSVMPTYEKIIYMAFKNASDLEDQEQNAILVIKIMVHDH